MLESVLGIAAGIYFVLASRWAARLAVRSWQRAFPETRVSEGTYRLMFRLVGSAFVVLGVLSVFGVIRDRP